MAQNTGARQSDEAFQDAAAEAKTLNSRLGRVRLLLNRWHCSTMLLSDLDELSAPIGGVKGLDVHKS